MKQLINDIDITESGIYIFANQFSTSYIFIFKHLPEFVSKVILKDQMYKLIKRKSSKYQSTQSIDEECVAAISKVIEL